MMVPLTTLRWYRFSAIGKYMTVNVKQKNAVKDKSKGITLTTYDKAAEVKNSSGKDYILNFYGNPKKLYRTEVHLNNQEVKDYLEGRGLFFNYYMIDEALLEDMFYHHLNSVIRFEKRFLYAEASGLKLKGEEYYEKIYRF